MEIEIREIDVIDYHDVVLLWNNELGNRNVNIENFPLIMDKMNKDTNYKTSVALLDNRAVGFITTVQVLSAGVSVGYLKINGLAVLKELQNKGIGTKLLKYVENLAFEKGLSFILLNSGFKRTDAYAFYEHNDYDTDSYCFDKVLNIMNKHNM